jgi:uncharacterized low-complexity protein
MLPQGTTPAPRNKLNAAMPGVFPDPGIAAESTHPAGQPAPSEERAKTMSKKTLKPVVLAAGAVMLGGMTLAGSAFAMNSLAQGYQVAATGTTAEPPKTGEATAEAPKTGETAAEAKGEEGKCGEGKCGEGKCGDDKPKEEATAEGAKGEEGKCGEGKCGEGKCGGNG